MSVLLRSVVLGLAAGGRSTLAVAAPVLVAAGRRQGAGPAAARFAAGAAVAAELFGDKLPTAPSRLESPAFLGRLVAGAVGGLAVSRLAGRSWGASLLPAAGGAAAAWAGSVAGASWRAAAGRSDVSFLRDDARAAVIEDAAALLLARASVAGL
ncbi:conserved hypothetical protein [Beutenbergia cavernae DSM 12333]|uniref:DUF4126 domain-containing protein n=1 Tax=Beutenbergia cavernae (strain ATCC BAA-8 / DSM 12333 / CCUG 43141 / JCM 11478 / NBRC 16432 / NCIMB 13614 / HKI 0122) TaxID=471853 RepID=C5BY38_BEUC1|nr:hypothetical protein [Beutenbergia cavernae]ACQ78932.1 conserved hypothetical protein [Beutenbergia cavernae DSM 12333]